MQFRVSSNGKLPYGTAWLQSLSSVGKMRQGPILYPPPCSSRVLLHLPFLHTEGGRSRVFALLRACRNRTPLKTGP